MADQRLTRMLDAVLVVAADLDLDAVLRHIAEAALDLVGARYAALGVLGDGDFLSRFVHVGMSDALVARIGHLPQGRGILGFLITHPEPLRLADLTAHPASTGVPEDHPPMGSFLGAPIRVRGRVFGNLYLTEKEVGSFTAEDEELVVALAAVAGVAIANAELFGEVQRLSVVEDRERIGRDLHDSVIQRLFALGLSLQAMAKRVGPSAPDVADRLIGAVDSLDETIRSIRSAIFSLQEQRADGLRRDLVDLVEELAPVLGLRPTLRLQGPIDLVVEGELGREVVTVLREALTNVARHAGAREVVVHVRLAGALLVVEVFDDGVGPPDPVGRGLGLDNLEARARARGGESSLAARPDGRTGSLLRWAVPV